MSRLISHSVICAPFHLGVRALFPGQVAQAAKPVGEPAGIIGHDDRIAANSRIRPRQSVSHLQRRGGGRCTATLVSQNALLTGAHYLNDRRGSRQLPPADMHFLATYQQCKAMSVSPNQAVILTSPHDQSATTNKDMHTDWAIVVFQKALPPRAIPLRPLPPRHRPNNPAVGPKLIRTGFSEDQSNHPTVDPSCKILGKAPSGQFLFSNFDTLRRDSGSPLLLKGIGEYQFSGVDSGILDIDQGRLGTIDVTGSSILLEFTKLKHPEVSLKQREV